MLNQILQYVKDGWVIAQRHPSLPLTIYNYSQATQYESHWDEITLQCRGLVLDDAGKIVARPFKKFFNWEELNRYMVAGRLQEPYEIFEKLDGSLGICFCYQGELVFASRGSFTSEQAIRGRKILDKYNHQHGMYADYTYLFEIIYPENRIVVDYGNEEKLVVIGVIHTESGKESSYEEMESDGFELAKKYPGNLSFEELKKLNTENAEGFVIRFADGYRMKIKFDDYITLHRIITNCSSYDIWESLMKFGKLPEDLLVNVPDEFYSWIKRLESELNARHKYITGYIKYLYDAYAKGLKHLSAEDFDKAYAMIVKNHELSGLLFSYKNGKDIREAVWKKIKPTYQKPFANKA